MKLKMAAFNRAVRRVRGKGRAEGKLMRYRQPN